MSLPIEKLLDEVEFYPVPIVEPTGNLPYATHMGVLKVMDLEIEVARLSTGARVITEAGMEAIFGEGWKEALEQL